jgi:hypothetical protein
MNYLGKVCPICERQFVVLKDVEEKAIFCTLKCLLEYEYQLKGMEILS